MAKTYIIVESEHQFAVYVEGEDLPMAFLAHEGDFVQLSAEGYDDEFADNDDDDRSCNSRMTAAPLAR
jgi:hypothetical protein